MDMCASGTQPSVLSQLQIASLHFRGHYLESKQRSLAVILADALHGFPTNSRKLWVDPQRVSLTFILTRRHVGLLQLIKGRIMAKQPKIIIVTSFSQFDYP